MLVTIMPIQSHFKLQFHTKLGSIQKIAKDIFITAVLKIEPLHCTAFHPTYDCTTIRRKLVYDDCVGQEFLFKNQIEHNFFILYLNKINCQKVVLGKLLNISTQTNYIKIMYIKVPPIKYYFLRPAALLVLLRIV